MRENEGVHVTHCCQAHGCKYGLASCPVTRGRLKQEYKCEYDSALDPCLPVDAGEDAIEAALDSYVAHLREPAEPMSEADARVNAGLVALLRKFERANAEFYYDFYTKYHKKMEDDNGR